MLRFAAKLVSGLAGKESQQRQYTVNFYLLLLAFSILDDNGPLFLSADALKPCSYSHCKA